MPSFGGADVVLFGIQAGLRLAAEARQAYVERTRERALTLPLPGLDHAATPAQARNYFRGAAEGRRHVVDDARLADLHARVSADGLPGLSVDEKQEYVDLYRFYLSSDTGVTGNDGLLLEDVVALNTIAQWRRGETPHPTALRRMAGSLVEIGIDWFAHGPGAGRLAGRSPARRLLHDLLASLDDHSFVEEGLDGVVESLFVATLDSLEENPDLLTDDPAARGLVSAVAHGLLADVDLRLAELGEDDRLFEADRLAETAGLVLRSVVRHSAETVLRDPATFLSVDDPAKAVLVTDVGTAMLDLVLAKDARGVALGALFSADGIDRVAKAALGVLAEHPELAGLDEDDVGLRRIVAEVAGGLAAETRALGAGLLPDVVRLVLERTAANLDLVWRVEAGEPRHLLVTAAKGLLAELARAPAAGVWRPALSRAQVLRVAESVLDDVAEHPEMLPAAVDGRPVVAAVVRTVIDEIARLELAPISPETVARLIEVAVTAAADRWALLEEIPGGGGAARTALGAVLRAVLATAFDPARAAARWTLTRGPVLAAVTGLVLGVLAEKGVDEAKLAIVREVLGEVAADLEDGKFSIEDLAARLEARLAA